MEIINRVYGNIEGYENTPQHYKNLLDTWKDNKNQPNLLQVQRDTLYLENDIDAVSRKLTEITTEYTKVLEQTDNLEDEVNNDKTAEPLKDETLKFSNYSYVPLAYYPIGCLFLLFLIYKKL